MQDIAVCIPFLRWVTIHTIYADNARADIKYQTVPNWSFISNSVKFFSFYVIRSAFPWLTEIEDKSISEDKGG